MKLRKVPCALSLVLVLAAVAAAQDNQPDLSNPRADTARPTLVVDEVAHDFGEVRPGRALRWTFRVKNVGNADLLIHSVAPD
jgi:hypothetical protein